MWSFFSRDPLKDFPFEVGNEVPVQEETTIWKLHKGKDKKTNVPVTVFAFDIKSATEAQLQLARAFAKRIKTIRHPNLLSCLDGTETDKMIYVVTENMQPLSTYLPTLQAKDQSELAISWGLHQITKGLSFLINDCGLVHNNICLSSVYVDEGGEWKLGGLDYTYSYSDYHNNAPVKILPFLERYDPPEKNLHSNKPTEKWSTDSWGLGCLVWEVFNGQLQQTSNLKSLRKIPKSLLPHYGELVSANPKSRPNPADFLKMCQAPNGFMCNQLIETMQFLEEIQIKGATEKTEFFSNLAPLVDNFPPEICRYKILPCLIHAFEFGNAGAVVLTPMFKLGKLLDTEEYQQRLVPCIVKLFNSTDRATRVKLLQEVEFFVDFISPALINDNIFPNVSHGFTDSNPFVRESTIKSMLHLAPKLNYKNLNEELLKHFARLQTKDDQGGIRTNTTVCLGKIACHLNPQMRQKVLGAAFTRALKDPFPPARQAAVLAMGATHNLFSLQDAAARLLPSLTPMLIDPEKSVRDQAFKTVNVFIEKLHRVSENPELTSELERDVLSGGVQYSASSWAGWAATGMSSITSKIYRSKAEEKLQGKASSQLMKSSAPSAPVPAAASTAPAEKKPTTHAAAPAPPAAPPASIPAAREPTKLTSFTAESSQEQEDTSGWEQDDWGNGDWGSLEEPSSTAAEPEKDRTESGDWDTDDWGSLEEPSAFHQENQPGRSNNQGNFPTAWGATDFIKVEETGVQLASSIDWGDSGSGSDFFSTVLENEQKPQKKTLPQQRQSSPSPGAVAAAGNASRTSRQTVQQKTKPRSAKPTSGWDEWGRDWTDQGEGWDGNTASGGEPSAANTSSQNQEPGLQSKRSQDLKKPTQRTGPLKLGAKKLAKD